MPMAKAQHGARRAMSERCRPQAGRVLLLLAAAVLGVGGVTSTVPATAQDVLGPGEPLRVASFDVSQAPALKAARPKLTARPSWRTSFGSEIRAKGRQTIPALGFEADVVLLQGVTSMRELRRSFPARQWKLVVSRQMIGSDDPLDPWSRDAINNQGVTAVAVRFQKGLRVSGQDHLMDLHASAAHAGQTTTAGTAVRLNIDGRKMWFLSVALSRDCLDEAQSCPALARLKTWHSERRQRGEPTISGGRFRADDPAAACPGQSIKADALVEGGLPPAASNQLTVKAGCLARLEIAR